MALRGCDSPADIGRHAVALRQRGIDFVMRRYSPDPARSLGAAEARCLLHAGLGIGALWERGAGAGSRSRRQGLLDGADALRQARAAGQPAGSAIYFGLPDGASRADIDGPLRAYFAGLRAALGGGAGYRVGVHGGHAWCAGLVDQGLAAMCWVAHVPPDAEPPRAEPPRHDLLQWPAARIVLDGAELRLSPVLGQHGRDCGLFQLSGQPAALGAVTR